MTIRNFLVTTVFLPALFLFPGAALGVSSEISELEAQLSVRRVAIESDRKSLNADCGSVPSSAAAKVANCRRRQADVVRKMDKYKADMRRLGSLKATAGEEIVRKEQDEYEKRKEAWTREKKRLVEERLKDPNKTARAIGESLSTGAALHLPARPSTYPPPTGFSTLSPGDVILVAADDRPWWNSVGDAMENLSSHATMAADVASSLKLSPASHTVLYLKEVNGTKLFLDHTAEKGSRVISEKQFFDEYGEREVYKAALAQPVKPDEARKIWEAAKDLTKKDTDIKSRKSGNIFDQTGYGPYGNENMVCSEADRWVLAQAGRNLPDTSSPVKRLLGIHYGPANIYADKQNFVITPLYAPANGKP